MDNLFHSFRDPSAERAAHDRFHVGRGDESERDYGGERLDGIHTYTHTHTYRVASKGAEGGAKAGVYRWVCEIGWRKPDRK